MKTTLGNNGHVWAEYFHSNNLISNGMTCDDLFKIAITIDNVYLHTHKWLQSDDFWEDFCYSAESIGYRLKY